MCSDDCVLICEPPVASFSKENNPRLAKRPVKTNGRLANRGLTSLVKEAAEVWDMSRHHSDYYTITLSYS